MVLLALGIIIGIGLSLVVLVVHGRYQVQVEQGIHIVEHFKKEKAAILDYDDNQQAQDDYIARNAEDGLDLPLEKLLL